jgi:excisionase family DNA binding protein
MSWLEKVTEAESVWQFRLMAVLLLMGVSLEDIENSVLDPWMDTKQLASYLGVHPETVRNLTRNRVLTGTAVGGAGATSALRSTRN